MRYFIVDAFTNTLFKGNPAGICVLDRKLDDKIMQKIAFENNLSETAFIRKLDDGYELRWFTPNFEIDLCGHATLASAFVICNFIEPNIDVIKFKTQSGILYVKRNDKLYCMTFPTRPMEKIDISNEILDCIDIVPKEIYSGRDLFIVLNDSTEVENYIPNYEKLQKLNKWLGIVLTAKGNNEDFVSRYFCPELKCEDPVTGSSHCNLIPFWAKRLNKNKMVASQLSSRGGILYCELIDENVIISGEAVLFLKGEII